MLGDRLHALLLGMLARRPVVGLTVEDKIAGCIGDIAGDRSVAMIATLQVDDPASVEAAVQRLWSAISMATSGVTIPIPCGDRPLPGGCMLRGRRAAFETVVRS